MSRKNSKNVRTQTFYLIKEDFVHDHQMFKDPNLKSIATKNIPGGTKSVFGVAKAPKVPKSVAHLLEQYPDHVDQLQEILESRSVCSVELVRVHGRVFAICFGQGRHLLKQNALEEGFGLLTALNSANERTIHGIKSRTVEMNSKLSQEQLTRAGNIHRFDFDQEEDILNALKTKTTDLKYGLRLDGKDSLTATADWSEDNTATLLGTYLERFQSKDYQEHFPYLHDKELVTDGDLIKDLDDLMLDAVRKRQYEFVWAAAPDFLDEGKGEAFELPYDSGMDLNVFQKRFKSKRKRDLEIRDLKSSALAKVEGNGERNRQCSVYQCLTAETHYDHDSYILVNGRWYQVSGAYRERIESFFDKLPKEADLFNRAQVRSFETETEFNNRMALKNKDLVLFDKANAFPYGGHDRMEFCDLYDRRKRWIIHLKSGKSSQMLSHLFAQAQYSAEFLMEPAFRKKLDQVRPGVLPWQSYKDGITHGQFTVVLGIIQEQAGDLRMPFFSKVTLRKLVQTLWKLGFDVMLAKVPKGIPSIGPDPTPGQGHGAVIYKKPSAA